MNRKQEREAWTAYFEGRDAKENKYGNERGEYASKHEAEEAAKLHALASRGVITDLQEQVRFTLIPGDGKLRPITYIADFCWRENGEQVVADAKGYTKNPVYRLKKKMLKLLHGIDIREI